MMGNQQTPRRQRKKNKFEIFPPKIEVTSVTTCDFILPLRAIAVPHLLFDTIIRPIGTLDEHTSS